MTPNRRRFPFKRNMSRKLRRITFMVIAAAIASGINYYNKNYNSDQIDYLEISEKKTNNSKFSSVDQNKALEKIRSSKNNTNAQFWVGLNGRIIKLLKDDNSGSRHQKFLIEPASDITLLVAHNIDLANRVPLKEGDKISLFGRYEWNNRGGVIHWTHHDPKGKKEGGWIKVNGKIYR